MLINTMMICRTLLIFSSCMFRVLSSYSCGIDDSPITMVYEGRSTIETYPWLGFLFYVYGTTKFSTGVVLVTRQIALAGAAEIDRIPKLDFRARARVVLGSNCTGRSIKIRDYSYHPEYSSAMTISALTIIQLETDRLYNYELRPICGPPSYFNNPIFYAVVLPDSCSSSQVTLHKMVYVPLEECRSYYRRFDLDVSSMWPTNTVCASSMSGGKCVWRSGAILTVKMGYRWRLLGFGVYGPGCEAPSRFLDYTQYNEWVRNSVVKIGTPAITRLGPNHIVMRRMGSNIQRFGKCDPEEILEEIYQDSFRIEVSDRKPRKLVNTTYNVTLAANVEYSCIIFKANYDGKPWRATKSKQKEPLLKLTYHCAGSTGLCYDFGFLKIQFYVNIWYYENMNFLLRVYGKEAAIIDPLKVWSHINRFLDAFKIPTFLELKANLTLHRYDGPQWQRWYG